jgi:hypothetical protein
MKTAIIPEVRRIKDTHRRSAEKMLLLMEDPGTSMNWDLWEYVKEEQIDIVLLQSRTSGILQPSELCLTGPFKRGLEKVPPNPAKHEPETTLPKLLFIHHEPMYSALDPARIGYGFVK